MVYAKDIALAACKYLGTPYSELDCQAFVERAMADCGLRKDLAGSNAWIRYVMKNGWVGTPEECKAKYGSIPVGAMLFILEQDGKEPAKYKGDGIGNASHIGLYTGMTGAEMCKVGNVAEVAFNFGNGAIHSSASRGFVCTSKFAGKSISGGWNRVGLWNAIDYGTKKEEVIPMGQAKVIGGSLNLREQPSKDAEKLTSIPDGAVITITDETGDWAKTSYNGKDGWVMKRYLQEDDSVTVPRKTLESIYDQIGDLLGLRG